MGRISVIVSVLLILTAFRISAQTAPSSFEFVENKGQWEKTVLFKGELTTGTFYLQQKGFTVTLHDPDDLAVILTGHDEFGAHSKANKKGKKIDYTKAISGVVTDRSITGNSGILHSHAYTVEFLGANANAQVAPDKELPSYNNYLLGNDPSKWASNVKIFQAVLYKNIYPNIDLRYYSENGTLKYDLIINPGGDPNQVRLQYKGADKLSVRNDELIVKTSVGEAKELYPYSYQTDYTKGRTKVETKYVVDGNTVRFQVGNYDKGNTLIIDPSLVFSSFTGSPTNQFGFTATPGPDGSLFSGGIVFREGFPVTPGAFQSRFNGGAASAPTDMAIMKFSANGSQRVYATYLGGSDNDYPHSLFSDPSGNLVVMGRSYSGNFPGKKIGPNLGPNPTGCNIVVTKLNAGGTGIIGSLVIGGSGRDGVNIKDLQRDHQQGSESLVRNYGDDSRSEVIIDGGGNIYVAGQTQSNDFPIVGGFQTAQAGKQDGVVLKINSSCDNLIWSTYFGGTGDDGAFVLDVSPTTGNIYVGGATTGGIPGVGAGTIGTAFQGGETDGFVAELTSGGGFVRSTYIGSNSVDIIYGFKFDQKGFPYVMGTTRGPWPFLNASYGNGSSSQFIAKLQPNLSAYVYSTTFGTGVKKPNMSPVAFLVDRCENVYISGWGGWIDKQKDPYDQAGVAGMPVSGDAIKSTTDNRDFYFIVIQKNASGLLYGTFFGQDGGAYGEHVDGGTSRYDQQGVIYQAMCANCQGGARFPTTPGVVGPDNPSGDGCNLAAVKIAFNFAGVASGPRPTVNGVRDSLGCAPFDVVLEDTIGNAISYEWRFGDGTPDQTTTAAADGRSIAHTFTSVGTYTVRLIAIDPNSCNERDTAYTTVKVGDDKANLAMTNTKLEPCESLNYRFTNNSTPTRKPFSANSFEWDFGDGSPTIQTGTGDVTHSFATPGLYRVRLLLIDTGYCNSPDSIVTELRVNPLVDARIETPPTGCAPYEALFTNVSLAGQTFEWDFGDGSTSTDVSPTHLYPNAGTYNVRLVARDPGTCNLVDDTTITIVVSNRPTAEFSHSPIVPVQNKPTIFTNLSRDGVKYKWLFGDGDSTIKNTSDTTLHQYNASGTYNACLITFNAAGCTDTVCHDVQADVLPLLDVPNAFTPGKFGRNSTIRVEGFGIARMSWKIYNRWGQKVFETNDRRGAWDGRFNGQLQPVDVYTYTLDVQYTDGTKTRKTGDITLIR